MADSPGRLRMRDTSDMTEDPSQRHQAAADAPLHEALLHLLDRFQGRDIHLSDLLDAMGHRGFGFVYILFGMLAAVLPAGLCSMMAVPVLLFSGQQVAGHARPYMPARFDGKRFSAQAIQSGILRRQRWIRRLERFAKPRWTPLTSAPVSRVAALFCFMLALVILAPGPFTNVPPGIAIALFGFAMAERDGLLTGVLGFVIGLSALIATALLVWSWIGQIDLTPLG
jgi:hypothetical protein